MKLNIGTKVNVLIIVALVLVGGASLQVKEKANGLSHLAGSLSEMMDRFKV